jgi:hypothetical protein
MSEQYHLPFHQVLRDELEDIKKRRLGPSDRAGQEPADGGGDDLEQERAQQRAALDLDLTGLALSGGGIRGRTPTTPRRPRSFPERDPCQASR